MKGGLSDDDLGFAMAMAAWIWRLFVWSVGWLAWLCRQAGHARFDFGM